MSDLVNEVHNVFLMSEEEFWSITPDDNTIYLVKKSDLTLRMYLGRTPVSNVEEVTELRRDAVDNKFYVLNKSTVYYRHDSTYYSVCDLTVEEISFDIPTFVVNGKSLRVLSYDNDGYALDDLKHIVQLSSLDDEGIQCSILWDELEGADDG